MLFTGPLTLPGCCKLKSTNRSVHHLTLFLPGKERWSCTQNYTMTDSERLQKVVVFIGGTILCLLEGVMVPGGVGEGCYTQHKVQSSNLRQAHVNYKNNKL